MFAKVGSIRKQTHSQNYKAGNPHWENNIYSSFLYFLSRIPVSPPSAESLRCLPVSAVRPVAVSKFAAKSL